MSVSPSMTTNVVEEKSNNGVSSADNEKLLPQLRPRINKNHGFMAQIIRNQLDRAEYDKLKTRLDESRKTTDLKEKAEKLEEKCLYVPPKLRNKATSDAKDKGASNQTYRSPPSKSQQDEDDEDDDRYAEIRMAIRQRLEKEIAVKEKGKGRKRNPDSAQLAEFKNLKL